MFGDFKLGVLGHESIKRRLCGLADVGVELSGQKVLELPKNEQFQKLLAARAQGMIVVDPPYTEEELDRFLGNVSLDLEFGNKVRIHGNPHSHPCERDGVLEDPIVDLGDEESLKEIEKNDTVLTLKDKPYILAPGALVKGITYRTYWMPYDLMGLVVGKSRIGRWGITTTVDAPKIDPGFSGKIVLELAHHGQYRFALMSGMPISQIIFFSVEGEIGTPYDQDAGRHFGSQSGIKYAVSPEPFLPRTIRRGQVIPKEK